MSKKKKPVLRLSSSPRYRTAIVVPCFNEEFRVDVSRFEIFAKYSNLSLIFVNDGSTDNTLPVLERMCLKLPRASVVNLPTNRGKAEAVRQGLLTALAGGAELVGFLDADLSTEPVEMLRFTTLVRPGEVEVVLGTRVRMLGSDIQRKSLRHVLGRIFATGAANVLGIRVYDTQCGAKLFMANDALKEALSQEFQSRWAFDVELLGRLLVGTPLVPGVPLDRFVEIPLKRWVDVADSKVKFKHMLRMGTDLIRIYLQIRRRRRNRDAFPMLAPPTGKPATRRGK